MTLQQFNRTIEEAKKEFEEMGFSIKPKEELVKEVKKIDNKYFTQLSNKIEKLLKQDKQAYITVILKDGIEEYVQYLNLQGYKAELKTYGDRQREGDCYIKVSL